MLEKKRQWKGGDTQEASQASLLLAWKQRQSQCRTMVLFAKKAAAVGHWLLNTEKDTDSAAAICKLRDRCRLCIAVTASKYSEVLMKGSKPCTASAAERGAFVGLQQELSQRYPGEAARLNKDHKRATDSHGKNGIFSNSQE